jgi:hypothetical protein
MIGRRRTVQGLAGTALAAPMLISAARAFDGSTLPRGRWRRIHEQAPGDAVRFRRQLHGGATFDSRRRRIVLFGSDEHGEDWTNAPLFFNVAALRWSRPYPDDDPSTYRVDRFGLPVAGANGDHPWAMHTYGAVTYHAAEDAVYVSIYPEHLQPGRFSNALAHVWTDVKRHPTWVLDLASQAWKPLGVPAVHFFPYATTYDADRRLIVGYRADGVYELRPRPIGWSQVAAPGLLGYHNNAVYDSKHRALVVFGGNEISNDIVVYEPAAKRHRRMATPGSRPPRAQYRPMAFHAALGQTAIVFDSPAEVPALPGPGTADTWLYDLGRDAWTRIEEARLPFRVGMNYNMVYDSSAALLLLVVGDAATPTSVWGLRL